MKRIAALAGAGRRGGARALAGPGDGEVKAVSVGPDAGKVEVVIDLQGAVEVQDFTLSNPARLVIDLTGARLTGRRRCRRTEPRRGEEHPLRAVRPGIVRVVIDLDVLKDYQVQKPKARARAHRSERTSFVAWSSTTAGAALLSQWHRPGPDRGAGVTTPRRARRGGDRPVPRGPRREAAQSRAPRITVTWDNAEILEVVAGSPPSAAAPSW